MNVLRRPVESATRSSRSAHYRVGTIIRRISTWHVVLVWIAIVAVSVFLRVRSGLERVAAANDPEQYVHDPAFQIMAFVWVYGLPLLVLLGLMIFANNRPSRNDKYHEVIQPAGLISVLLNRNRPFGDRHDAAMDLAGYDNPEAIDALTRVKEDPAEDEDIVEEAEQSLLEIERRRLTN